MPKRIPTSQKPTPNRRKQERTAWRWYDLAKRAIQTGDPGAVNAANSLGHAIGAPRVAVPA